MGEVAKVIRIRGLPDDVHAALVSAAEARGMSLTAYVRTELEAIARRAEASRSNAEVSTRRKRRSVRRWTGCQSARRSRRAVVAESILVFDDRLRNRGVGVERAARLLRIGLRTGPGARRRP